MNHIYANKIKQLELSILRLRKDNQELEMQLKSLRGVDADTVMGMIKKVEAHERKKKYRKTVAHARDRALNNSSLCGKSSLYGLSYEYDDKVTCKTCIKMLEGFTNENN